MATPRLSIELVEAGQVKLESNLTPETLIGILERLKHQILQQPVGMRVDQLKSPVLSPKRF